MSRWRAYRCSHCGGSWLVDARTIPFPVRCPGCGLIAYAVSVDKPAPAARSMRLLAEEMRRASRPWPSGAIPAVPGSDVARWAERIEAVAAQVEREEVSA